MFGSPKWWLRPRIGRSELVLCINDLISVDARSLLMVFGMDSVIIGEKATVLVVGAAYSGSVGKKTTN